MDLSVSEKFATCNNIIKIDKHSNIDLHEEVYKIAEYFKEELNYNSVPYSPLGMLPEEYKVLLFTEEALDNYNKEPMLYRIYGACLFSKIKFTGSECWALEWIWFHPFFRNRGNLKKYWGELEDSFGNFIIKEPISNDMNAFLKHINSKCDHKIL